MAKKKSKVAVRRTKRATVVTIGKGGYFDAYKSKKGEVTTVGKAIRGVGSAAAGALGPYLGVDPSIAARVGNSLSGALSKWLGFGDYSVRVNSIVDPSRTIPMMHQSGQSIVVRHKEFVCDVRAPNTSYNIVQSFPLNPGLPTSFPWLSTVAAQFQEYTWRGVVYHYIPTSGMSVNSATTALGTVMLHTDYRVTAPQPVSKTELLNEYFASDGRPCDAFVHPIECDPKENPYNVQYVRIGNVPVGEDPKSYDLGRVNLAVAGVNSTGSLGELWVTYEVELRKPQLNPPVLAAYWETGAVSAAAAFGLIRSDPQKAPTPISTIAKFFDNIGLVSNDGASLIFPRGLTGVYKITMTLHASVTANNTSSPAVTNALLINPFNLTNAVASVAASNAASYEFIINIVNADAQASVTVQPASWSGNTGIVRVERMDPAVATL